MSFAQEPGTLEAFAQALSHANLAALRIAALYVTDDERLAAIEPEAGSGAQDRVAAPPIAAGKDSRTVCEVAAQVLLDIENGSLAVPPAPSRERLHELLEVFFGHEILADEMPFWEEEFGTVPLPRAVSFDDVPKGPLAEFEVLVVGAGMSGISAAVYLQAAGIKFTVAERNGGVGGTWFANVYPGARVDLASRAYSFTYERDYPWRHVYATQPELLEYFNYCVDKHGVREQISLNTEVRSARWDGARQVWDVELASPHGVRTVTVNAIISAVGLFTEARYPDMPGLDQFEGKIMHTARWDTSFDVAGKRIAVIGTGSSGVQIVAPLSETAAQLTVFQRSGTWLANVPEYLAEISPEQQWVLDNFPYYVNWVRVMQLHGIGDTRTVVFDVDPQWKDPDTVSEVNWHLREGLIEYMRSKVGDDPELVKLCTPSYPPFAKRMPKDNGWYDAMTKDHVELVGEAIQTVTPTGIRDAAGKLHEFDVIVLATGFDANDYLATLPLTGRGGATLDTTWAPDGARAYLGIAIPGFPNLFCMYGPNTNGKSGTPAAWGEMQARYAIECIGVLLRNGLSSLEVTREAYDTFNAYLDERLSGLIWMDQRQRSYYRNDFNRVATNGAWLNREYWQYTRTPVRGDFIETSRDEAYAEPAAGPQG